MLPGSERPAISLLFDMLLADAPVTCDGPAMELCELRCQWRCWQHDTWSDEPRPAAIRQRGWDDTGI